MKSFTEFLLESRGIRLGPEINQAINEKMPEIIENFTKSGELENGKRISDPVQIYVKKDEKVLLNVLVYFWKSRKNYEITNANAVAGQEFDTGIINMYYNNVIQSIENFEKESKIKQSAEYILKRIITHETTHILDKHVHIGDYRKSEKGDAADPNKNYFGYLKTRRETTTFGNEFINYVLQLAVEHKNGPRHEPLKQVIKETLYFLQNFSQNMKKEKLDYKLFTKFAYKGSNQLITLLNNLEGNKRKLLLIRLYRGLQDALEYLKK